VAAEFQREMPLHLTKKIFLKGVYRFFWGMAILRIPAIKTQKAGKVAIL